MGEITEMILDGILCELCGVYIGNACGYTRKCVNCTKTSQKKRTKKTRSLEKKKNGNP